ncbi:guanylate kinase [Varunaivibrio sulfuroxidans]|nr:guanylate kinase [Varunaivibrio sulfuroxidans]WES32245.1 guanylate kinase [Varunaivibrio sulfuroxidans]
MLVMSSPSGAGKTTISRALLAADDNLSMSVSATTRPPRPGEVDGVDYYFIEKKKFEDMVEKGEFLEHARVFDNYYGTPRAPVEAALKEGRDVLFDVDWQGTQQLGDSAGKDLVRVFILPPSYEELERRLYKRAQDSVAVVKKRMAQAAKEMSHYYEYDYIVVNVDVAESVANVAAILRAERLRRERQHGLHDFVAALSADQP